MQAFQAAQKQVLYQEMVLLKRQGGPKQAHVTSLFQAAKGADGVGSGMQAAPAPAPAADQADTQGQAAPTPAPAADQAGTQGHAAPAPTPAADQAGTAAGASARGRMPLAPGAFGTPYKAFTDPKGPALNRQAAPTLRESYIKISNERFPYEVISLVSATSLATSQWLACRC